MKIAIFGGVYNEYRKQSETRKIEKLWGTKPYYQS